jgi:AraC-like DNA-binding protein
VRLKNASSGLRQRPRGAALDSLKRLVEQHLDSPALSAEFVCARSGWSRATVYRLFEVEGGLARYIRKRHLLHALCELTSGQPSHLRILDLAFAHQFASEASFNRAFRRAFGIPPGRVRDLAASSAAAPRGEPHLPTDSESEAVGLLMRLRTGTGTGTPSVAASSAQGM